MQGLPNLTTVYDLSRASRVVSTRWFMPAVWEPGSVPPPRRGPVRPVPRSEIRACTRTGPCRVHLHLHCIKHGLRMATTSSSICLQCHCLARSPQRFIKVVCTLRPASGTMALAKQQVINAAQQAIRSFGSSTSALSLFSHVEPAPKARPGAASLSGH